jgi:hypothetical protein
VHEYGRIDGGGSGGARQRKKIYFAAMRYSKSFVLVLVLFVSGTFIVIISGMFMFYLQQSCLVRGAGAALTLTSSQVRVLTPSSISIFLQASMHACLFFQHHSQPLFIPSFTFLSFSVCSIVRLHSAVTSSSHEKSLLRMTNCT